MNTIIGSLIALLYMVAPTQPENKQEVTKQYVCNKTQLAVAIDGDASDAAWDQVEWTPFFTDIKTEEEASYPSTAKLLWDDNNLYILVCFVDPDLWAEQTVDDSKVYLDNAFELFIDPNGNGKNYLEYEVNARGTTWDLAMNKPYKEGGKPDSSFKLEGVEKAIKLNGTINDSQGADVGWTLELAIPLHNFAKLGSKSTPTSGDVWRMNLARVHWELAVNENGKYEKQVDPVTKKPICSYWTWSPHGEVDMHRPDMFGELLFK